MNNDREFLNKLIRMTLPIALQSLMLALVAAADAVMLGRVEQNQMAAVSLATQIQFIQNMAIMSITAAGTLLGAQYWGKRDEKSLNDLFCMMLRTSAVVSFVFFLGCFFFPRQLMMIYTNEPVLIEIGVGYLKIAGFSYLLTGISQCYLTLMKVTDHVSATAMISSGAVIINIVLNAILIFGLLGLPAMEAEGAATATLLARIIELIWAVVLSRRPGHLKKDLRRLFARNRLLSKDFAVHTLKLMGGAFVWGIGFSAFTAVMGHMGTDAAAANSIAAVVRDLVCCACNGIASAGGIMVGNELGAGKLEKGKEYGIRLAKISFVIGFITMGLVLLVTVPVVKFILLTDTARSYLIGMMVIMAVYMIGRCVNTVIINGVFAAGGDTLFDMYSLLVCMWGIALPAAFLGAFVFHWSVYVVYACTCLDEVGKIPWVIAHFRKYKWVKDLTR